MSWRDPTPFEVGLFADARARWPEQDCALLPLARVLCLAPRIEPMLLRNARRKLVPAAAAEVESLLWFSPLVSARSTREIVLHLGVAKLLADELAQQQSASPAGPDGDRSPLERVWAFTCLHTRHWNVGDRWERDLRYAALRDDADGQQRGIKAILKRIQVETDEARRLDFARLVKRTLPVITAAIPPTGPGPQAPPACEEARLLAQYAALALGDTGGWVQPGRPQALPTALAVCLPAPLDATDDELQLGCALRWDADNGQVLHFLDPAETRQRIRFPSPTPARLHVAPDGRAGDWHDVQPDSRIRIDPPSAGLRLTTLDGRQWDLRTRALPDQALSAGAAKPSNAAPPPLLLIHVEADREDAQAIAEWLRAQAIAVDLVAETGESAAPGPETASRGVRLWSESARAYWAERGTGPAPTLGNSLLLRIDASDPPAVGDLAGRLLDWHWGRVQQAEEAERLRHLLTQWWQHGELAEDGGDAAAPTEQPGSTASDDEATRRPQEIERLLAEIADSKTEPPRRLEIGDRLAELGDPRPGVGTVEIEVPIDGGAPAEAPPVESPTQVIQPAPAYPPEIQALLDEIADPKTTPPRRLEIGDELEKLGDPRPGVGLRPNGLPDIDWVEVPGGPFIYQVGETRDLPTFWIGRYPVTNAQFQAFFDDGGYGKRAGLGTRIGKPLGLRAGGEPEWWGDLKRPEPESPRWPHPNRPRNDVDWYEAVAFTRWLNARLGLPEGSIRLPTELEWEKAARGPEGRIYPWGNEYQSGFANVNERSASRGEWSLEQTTAVGLYPHGRSPDGVEDLAGNVWEWCLNKYDDPEAVAPDTSGASRGLRGGSWYYYPDLARADYRNGNHPENRNDGRGFRLLSSVPIEPVRR